MDKGANGWSVSYSSIIFFEGVLRNHGNVSSFVRSRDIMFSISRRKPLDSVNVLIVNTYTFGVADFYKVRAEFPEGSCIVLAGDWNAYTLVH